MFLLRMPMCPKAGSGRKAGIVEVWSEKSHGGSKPVGHGMADNAGKVLSTK